MRILEQEEIIRQLADLPEWSSDGDSLVRDFTAADFPAAIALVDRVAAAAEAMNHHPDIDIRWRKLHFRLSTHDAGGVTDLDLDLARGIEALIADG